MVTFGLVTEGPTDQEVLASILAGFFGSDEILITPLQPIRDATADAGGQGDWVRVLEYCGSSRFRQAFGSVRYVIVQVDTDCSEQKPFDVPHREDGRELSVDELVDRVSAAIIARIPHEFYEEHRDQIIFAISVHSIECWLLPLYYPNAPAKSGKITGCLQTLNQALSRKYGFTIDTKHKEVRYYRSASDGLANRKYFSKAYPLNPSLKRFVEELERHHILLDE